MNVGMNYSNNINFNGKLEIKDVHIDKKRWENIAKIYEDITTKGQGANWSDMSLFSEGKKKELFIEHDDVLNGYGIINKNTYAKLMKLTDDEIARKLAKFYKLLQRGADLACNFVNKFYLLTDGYRDKVNLDDEIFGAVLKAQNIKSRELIQKDKILRDIDFQFGS